MTEQPRQNGRGGSRLDSTRQGGSDNRKKKKKEKIIMVVMIVLAVIMVLAAAAAVLYSRWVRKPSLPSAGDEPSISADAPTAGLPGDPDVSGEDLDLDSVQPKVSGERKSKDYYTVLVFGADESSGLTDSIMLVSYDVTNQKATVMSIPRDTMVNVSWDIKRINSVYNAYGGGDKGIQALYKEIAQLVGFEPDYQVVVEWEAVGQIVEAMGGVWFDVPQDMNYDDPLQDLSIHQTAGYRLLTGEDAMQVLRYRHDNPKNGHMRGYPDGDLGRIKTQQALLKAMVNQLLKLENIGKVNQFAKVFQENVETDLSFQNILWFAKSAYLGGLKVENVNFVTMPNTGAYCYSRTYGNMQSYVTPKAQELLDLVNSELSPFTEVFTLSDLDIMSVNADGSISSSTGHVEDSRAAQPHGGRPATTPSTEPDPEDPGTEPDPGTTDPGTEPDPGTTDPGTEPDPGTTDPGTEPDPGTTDPGTEPDPGTDPGTTDPGTEPDPGSASGDGAA